MQATGQAAPMSNVPGSAPRPSQPSDAFSGLPGEHRRALQGPNHPLRSPPVSPRSALSVVLLLAVAGCVPVVRENVRHVELIRGDMPRSLPVPVEGVAKARVTASFGDPRSGGRTHEGVDIFASRGTPVRSTTVGRIEYKGMRGLGGRIVRVTGPGGYVHYYAHLEDWGPQAIGDWVARGEVIGFVGDSGNAVWGPTHLHYGIYRPDGRAIDPYPLLADRAPKPTQAPGRAPSGAG
jgi:peptidoglycan LD-endopeptidase LytH